MFITRKEFEETKEDIKLFAFENGKDVKELKNMVLSLAKEIGYTWESEAVKEKSLYRHATKVEGIYIQEPCEKAVLKWGWKKTDCDCNGKVHLEHAKTRKFNNPYLKKINKK